jgi:hypothetical protein
MFPWLVFWAPQLHFPWSGSVAQRIEPNTHWFFDSIAPDAGNAAIEKRAFEVASYGKQIGLITEVLLGMAKTGVVSAAQVQESLQRLELIHQRIEAVKQEEQDAELDQLAAQLAALRKHRPAAFKRLMQGQSQARLS